MLNSSGKTPNDEYFVFYNSELRTKDGKKLERFHPVTEDIKETYMPISPDKAVMSSGDDTTGGNSDGGDDETLTVDLNIIDPKIEQIVFVVTIYDCKTRKQNFGQVRNSYIRIYDANSNEEICKYDLDEDYSIETSVEFGRLYKRDNEWKFEAMGIGYPQELDYFVQKYT